MNFQALEAAQAIEGFAIVAFKVSTVQIESARITVRSNMLIA